MLERLQNILSHAGVASRRHSAEIIESGRVKVDGVIVTQPGERFDPELVKITVDGKAISSAEKTRTIMMYKPMGVLSSMSDPFGGTTVADVLRGQISERLVPVGRLDKDSEGLLLMSNDGDLTLRLTHPRYEHEKIYMVRAAGRWSDDKLETLRSSLVINGYKIRPCRVDLLRVGRDNVHLLKFHLREGRKRQIRYMCSAAHLVVVNLKRVQIGELRLDESLKPGEWRDLTPAELVMLTQ
jgi:pseudouridine synthase